MDTARDIKFAVNHMAAPQLSVRAFFGLATRLGLSHVEIRNDIADEAIADGTPASEVKAAAEGAGVNIATINALQRFNDWNDAREKEAIELADYARACRAEALILVPKNDGTGREDGVRQKNVRTALEALRPILADRGLIGLVEPLGFEICSLRSKREAVEAIEAIGGAEVFRITHDTFHHYLAGEPELFPAYTGLVHISGVTDPAVSPPDMRDAHRVLVDDADRLGNVDQIAALIRGGYNGLFSFEPFAEELRLIADPAAALGESIEFIRAQLRSKAA